VNASMNHITRAVTKAQDDLALLQRKIVDASAMLLHLEKEVAEAERRVGRTTQLVAVNEQLVLSVVRAYTDAEAAARLLLSEIEPIRTQQQEANSNLVLAALEAQELQAASERAQKRQAESLAVIAHELRNPLTPISNAVGVLSRMPTDNPQRARMHALIERQVLRLSRLVGDLLDVSRASTGKLRLDRRVVEMTSLIEEVDEAARPVVESRRQTLTVHIAPGSFLVHGDHVRLTQVLGNVLENASKYTPQGGSIDLTVVAADHTVVVTVSDTGIGITAEVLPHVFDPFVQDKHAIGFNSAGLGIGLTVVRELVEAHGGTVGASSAGAGLGSQFVIRLPLMSGEAGTEAPVPKRERPDH
jgi:signal transduction histidine kinase